MMVTVFEKLTDPKGGKLVDHEKVLKTIQTGGKLRDQIQEVRQLMEIDPEKAADKKKKLPGVCFGGTFSKRANDALIEASGLMVLDFDKTELFFGEKLAADEFIYSYWLSPSGTGHKALVKIPIVKSDAEYKKYFYAFAERFPEIDPSGKDIARFCFFSFDPTLVIREDAKTWEVSGEVVTPGTEKKYQQKTTRTDWKKVGTGLNMISLSETGNVHATIVKAGKLMGGYIATGEIDEVEIMDVFEREIRSKMRKPSDFKTQWKTFTDGIAYGKLNPIESIQDTSIENKIGSIDFTLEGENAEKLREKFKNGKLKVYEVGWDCMVPHFGVVLGATTYLYGSPYTGKSQWWFEVLINLSIYYQMKHAVLSPETGDSIEIFEELVQIYIGQDFGDNFNNQMTEADRERGMEFIAKYFIIIDPEEAGVNLTPMDFLDYVNTLERKYNTKIHTATADPWNELHHEMSEGAARDLYMDNQLKLIRRHAKRNNRHVCLITHTTDQDKKITRGTETFYPVPTPRDIAWGRSWHRKGLMMLAFWRYSDMIPIGEVKNIEGMTIYHNSLMIQIQKAKPKGAGKRTGKLFLLYDAKRHKYYEDHGGAYGQHYAHKIDDSPKEVVVKTFLDPSIPEHSLDDINF